MTGLDLQVELEFITPIDNILNTLGQQTDEEKTKNFLWLGQFYQTYEKDSALNYAQKTLKSAQNTENQDLEAQTWLFLGDLKNQYVEQETVNKRGWGSYGKYTNASIELDKIAEKSGYAKSDIQRWNHFGGYIPLFDLWSSNYFVVYPNLEQFSDREYLAYLKIRETQQDPDKIAWGLKKLGDLYRLKIGYEKAEEYYLKLLRLRESGLNQEKTNWIWGHLAHFYLEQNKFEEAEKYLLKLYEVRKKTQILKEKFGY